MAAGSDEYGFFFIFHRVSTGPSAGEMPPFHGERSTIGSFSGNSAHSNGQVFHFVKRQFQIRGRGEC